MDIVASALAGNTATGDNSNTVAQGRQSPLGQITGAANVPSDRSISPHNGSVESSSHGINPPTRQPGKDEQPPATDAVRQWVLEATKTRKAEQHRLAQEAAKMKEKRASRQLAKAEPKTARPAVAARTTLLSAVSPAPGAHSPTPAGRQRPAAIAPIPSPQAEPQTARSGVSAFVAAINRNEAPVPRQRSPRPPVPVKIAHEQPPLPRTGDCAIDNTLPASPPDLSGECQRSNYTHNNFNNMRQVFKSLIEEKTGDALDSIKLNLYKCEDMDGALHDTLDQISESIEILFDANTRRDELNQYLAVSNIRRLSVKFKYFFTAIQNNADVVLALRGWQDIPGSGRVGKN